MSEFKGTPGKWRVDGPDMFGDYNILHPADALAVAAVVSNLRPEREVAANADLVAAAPDLYAALEGLVSALCHEHNKHLPYWQDALAALARSTGQEM